MGNAGTRHLQNAWGVLLRSVPVVILTSNTSQTELELRVLDYQFPAIDTGRYDSNWLLVQVTARTPTASWSRTDPCLLTWEAHWLLNWLSDVMSGSERDQEMSFLEPNLFFRLAGRQEGGLDLCVCVNDELLPPDQKPADGDPAEIPLRISVADLHECVTCLSRELVPYPVRGSARKRCRPYNDPRADCVLCGRAERR